ncbi:MULTISPECIES: XRE family transcriptional regulator [unclassified Pseudomonas]|uniref:XRE family transcriptional regulator n=1 Tax=unclassified Pseudomonas TaxID=196821 RepID=UPI0002A257AD|nr:MULTISPECIES: XRE family transcriptional regulator [unclassified Pseudomonas]MBB1607761.1 transcriptional regulator [Pseudomonas sp. UMC76]MBB1638959.1 transcriptional regulator [Pseudomonas sp. UME83]NTX90550.1 transcriptional regulator [Pseudomonas sp. UMA643]NTY18968.1 transcriptional regulator [Pseudomonas sp. UMC3103]NTY25100.1 transcriptional regulator [Pseudomonas sp. UMA603]
MAKSLEQVMKGLPTARRQKIEQRGAELIAEQMTLQELRKSLNLTQEAMADLLAIKQGNVSKVEKRTDMLISTLREYVEAMGGTLELVARLPGRPPVKLEGFRDLHAEHE